MKRHEVENRFVEALKERGLNKLEHARDQNGILSISLRSPCAEIGSLIAIIKDEEIALYCNVSHVHSSRSSVDAEAESAPNSMIDKAAGYFSDLVQERAFVSREYSPNGQLISSGWGPIESLGKINPDYNRVIKSQYGGPSTKNIGYGLGS